MNRRVIKHALKFRDVIVTKDYMRRRGEVYLMYELR